MKKIARYCMFFAVIFFVSAVVCWFVVLHFLIIEAQKEAQRIAEPHVKVYGPELFLMPVAAEVFKEFRHVDPSQVFVLRLRPFVTNRRLPEWFRLPDGVIETLVKKGFCDNAARMLKFIYKEYGYSSVQWNMVLPDRAHSALLVKVFAGEQALVDPFYGYATAVDALKMISPEEARQLMKEDKPFETIFYSLGEGSEPEFYRHFADVKMAAEGALLTIDASLPPLNGAPLIFGEINDDFMDVKAAAGAAKIYPYWYYIGHKYNREWVRILKVAEPVRIEMTLMAEPEEGVLRSVSPAPAVNGKTLTWELQPGEALTFRDGEAKLSMKRMNSFIGVDRIVFSPLN